MRRRALLKAGGGSLIEAPVGRLTPRLPEKSGMELCQVIPRKLNLMTKWPAD